VAQPAKVGPFPLFALREPLDHSKLSSPRFSAAITFIEFLAVFAFVTWITWVRRNSRTSRAEAISPQDSIGLTFLYKRVFSKCIWLASRDGA
jgi:hypothetical protein